jgi:hypothetical protein
VLGTVSGDEADQHFDGQCPGEALVSVLGDEAPDAAARVARDEGRKACKLGLGEKGSGGTRDYGEWKRVEAYGTTVQRHEIVLRNVRKNINLAFGPVLLDRMRPDRDPVGVPSYNGIVVFDFAMVGGIFRTYDDVVRPTICLDKYFVYSETTREYL